MGAEESVPIPPPPPGFEYFVFTLTNYYCCKIRTIFGNQTDLSIIRDAILQNWVQGLESEKPKLEQSWGFRLRGYPFTKGTSSVQAASSRKMICQILQYLHNAGLELTIISDLSRLSDLSTFYFCRSMQGLRPIQYPMFCVGLSSTDKLQLVNAPENMLAVIRNAIMTTWSRGIQSEGPTENSFEFKLHGNPWWSMTEEGVQARLLLAAIISGLAQQHWVFHASANIKSTSDSLFFKYDPEDGGPQINHHFIISLNNTDKLRLINAPETLLPVVRQVITSVWTVMGGIQREQDYHGSWEFKLSGNPWWSHGNEAVMARFLICKILESMRGQGWDVKTSVDISRSSKDKSSLVMSPCPQQPDTTPVMCLSLSATDKIRLINAPQDLVGICREILMTRWYKGIGAEEQMQTSCSSYQFKLNGNPWHGYSINEAMHIRSVLCYFIQAFAARGWKYLTSADVSAKYQKQGQNGPTYPVDVHSWWFAYQPGTVPAIQPAATTLGAQYLPPPSYEEIFKQ